MQLLYFHITHDALADLHTDEYQVLMRELNEFAHVTSNLQLNVFTVETVYEPWIYWCLKRPTWATKFKIGG